VTPNAETGGPQTSGIVKWLRWLIVRALESLCGLFHPVTHHRPWLWLPIHNVWCLPATWSSQLEERWHTGVWTDSQSGRQGGEDG